MKVQDVTDYYKTKTAACKAIDAPNQVYSQWERQGYIPLKHQYAFEKETKRKLKMCAVEILAAYRKLYSESEKND